MSGAVESRKDRRTDDALSLGPAPFRLAQPPNPSLTGT